MTKIEESFPQLPCACFGADTTYDCVCSTTECFMRNCEWGNAPKLTPEQREWCVREADWAGEGAFERGELEQLTDAELASAVIYAWTMYVDSMMG